MFGPKLLYFPLECHAPAGCRIECFQNGLSVALREGIGPQDEVRLVVNAGISDEIVPRWIEVRPFGGSNVQSILLSADTLCNLVDITIAPRGQP